MRDVLSESDERPSSLGAIRTLSGQADQSFCQRREARRIGAGMQLQVTRALVRVFTIRRAEYLSCECGVCSTPTS